MEKHRIDIEESKRVHDKHSKYIQIRQCYSNIAHILNKNLDKFISGQWKIAYGYYSVSHNIPNLLARHCFIIDENNSVIDPTVIIRHPNDDELKDWEYFTFKIFTDIREYFSMTIDEQYYDLSKSLRHLEQEALKWGYENGYGLID